MKKYLFIIACMMFFYSCSEENNRVPVTSDSTVPGKVSNVRAEALPGAVKLTYDMPAGYNLSYVKAECLINGTVRQVKATPYQNNLTIEGFADSRTYTVNLYSVNRSEKESEPVVVQVQPLTPNFRDVFSKIQLIEDWGGASVFFENPNEADLAITIMNMDSTGFWNQGETFYTKLRKGMVSVRGMDPLKTKFGAYICDRWNNTSDTLVKELTPRFEKRLDRTKCRELPLPGDESPVSGSPGWLLSTLWDGSTGQPGYHTNSNGRWPQSVSFDLGYTEGVLLSRCRIWPRAGDGGLWDFADRNIKKFEIWGTMDYTPDGSWDSWKLLLEGEMFKPSGLPSGQYSEDDYAVIANGHEFYFDRSMSKVRYLRLKVNEVYGGAHEFFLVEIAFWGNEASANPL